MGTKELVVENVPEQTEEQEAEPVEENTEPEDEKQETTEAAETENQATETENQANETDTVAEPEKRESETETVKEEKKIAEEDSKISRSLIGTGKKSQKELYKFFMKNNKKAKKRKVKRLAKYYIEEAAAEGINSDVAFVQMCHETGFLRFGNLVSEDMNNFCGLGSIDINHRGVVFESERMGVRAHIQHLQAYATTADIELHNELVDPRYEWVHKTKLVTDIFGLTKTWATDPKYGEKLDAMLTRLENNDK